MVPLLLLTASLHLPTQHHTLDNGLEVVLVPDSRAPLIASELSWRVGAAEDPVPGMAHFVEHLMFEGEYDALLAEAGGESNAWTSHDWTVYTAAAPADALERLLYLESRRMADPLAGVSDDDIDNQISVVLAERSLARGGGRGDRALAESLYAPGHPLHGPVLGDPDAIAGFSRAQVEAFLADWYQPSNAVLVLGGDFEPAEALARITRWFGELTGPPAPDRAAEDGRTLSGERVLVEETTPTVVLAWPTVPGGHDDEAALDLLAEAITDALRARVAGGRLDDGRAWTDNGRIGGRLVVSVSHPRRGARALLREAERAVQRALSAPMEDAVLAAHLARWRMYYMRAAQPLQSRVGYVAGCVRGGAVPNCLEAVLQEHEAVTPSQIQAAGRRYLSAEAVVLAVHPEGHRSLSDAEPVSPL